MKRSKKVTGTTERLVTGLFQDILESLPTGCASLRIQPTKDPQIFSVSLVPSNERSAEFGTMVSEDGIYSVFFGKKPTFTDFECPWEIGLPRSAGLDRHFDIIRKMCLAVIAGRCEHHFERRSTRGLIHVSEKEVYRVADIGIMRLLWPRRKNLQVVK
jgi:hypothetical protein